MIDPPLCSTDIISTAPAITPPSSKLTVVEEKPAKAKYQSEYEHYLQSPRWRTLARAVQMRAKGKCEICYRADGAECAHLTYERIFNERLTDLLWLCKKCHRELDPNR